MPATLKRSTFTVSRAQEFFTVRELQAQCGLPKLEWPLMIVKELADNALDACETAGTLPQLSIAIDDDVIELQDNGPGLSRETLERQLDYLTRTSTNSRYVSPTRGQQGNAIKTILAAPFVVDGEQGLVEVATANYAVAITVRVDPIRQEPVIEVTDRGATVKTGTKWRVHYPAVSSSIAPDDIGRFLPWLAAMNPHLSIHLDGEAVAQRTQDTISKWLPSAPTFPHWYTAEDLQQLIAAYLAGNEDKFVRDLVREFAGLSSTKKAKGILESTGLGGSRLSDLLVDGDFDRERIAGLLKAMQAASKPLRPDRLGVIGREHLRSTLVDRGGEADSFRYKRGCGESDGVPYIIESAFAHCPEAEERELVTGINWTPTYRDPFTSVGEYGDSLSGVLGDEYAGSEEPIIVLVHLATPKPVFTDRGKTSLSLPHDEREAVVSAVLNVIGPWTKQRRREERDAQSWLRRREQLARQKRSEVTWLEAMLEVMPDAYRHVAGETGVAEARQLMYAARPRLQEITGRTLRDDYFSYTLLAEVSDAESRTDGGLERRLRPAGPPGRAAYETPRSPLDTGRQELSRRGDSGDPTAACGHPFTADDDRDGRTAGALSGRSFSARRKACCPSCNVPASRSGTTSR